MSTGGLAPSEEVVDQALAASSTAGCVVLVEDSSEAEVRFANNTATTNGMRRDRRVTVVAIAEHGDDLATGIARRGGAVEVGELVKAAEAEAADAPAASDAAPLLAPGAAQPATASIDDTGFSLLSPFVSGLAPAFSRAEAAEVVLAGFAEHRVTTTVLGTSSGLRASHRQPTGAVHLVGRAADGRRSAWSGAGSADFADVSVEGLEEKVRRGLDWASRQIDLDAGRYEVVLPAEAVADLMVAAVESMGGREAEEGRTVFSAPAGGTRLGEALSELPFDLRSDPYEPGLSCAPFLATSVSTSDVSVFDNGLDLERTYWLRAGALERLLYHRAGAKRSGQQVTAPIDNLVLELAGATGDLDSLVASTERGLLLTCLWYIREVDPSTLLLTGLTRDGVYLVENGKVTGAVNNFRFNESPVDLLGRATEASASTRALGREFGEWYNRTAMPALRIPDFNMSSVSPAS